MTESKGSLLEKIERLESGGSYAEALKALEEADWSDDPDLWLARCSLLASMKSSATEGAYLDAIARWPGHAEFAFNFGNWLLRANRVEEALGQYREAVRRSPDHTKAILNLGMAAAVTERWADAEPALQRAVSLFPEVPQVRLMLARTHVGLGRPELAAKVYEQYLWNNPNDAAVLLEVGQLLQTYSNFSMALKLIARAIPHATPWQRSLLHGLMARLYGDNGQPRRAVESIRESLAFAPDNAQLHLASLMMLHYAMHDDPSEIMRAVREFGERHSVYRPRQHKVVPDTERRLRVGLFSGSFRRHPVGYLTLRAFEALDPARYELVGLAAANDTDDYNKRYRACCAEWHDVGKLSERELADFIADQRIDILFEMAGSGRGSKLLAMAYKPAPVIIKWVGNQYGSSGLPEIDYYLSDAVESPPGYDEDFAEELIRMPDGYVVYDPPDYAPEVGPLPALANGYVTFGSFNNANKLNDFSVELWARVLREVPRSRLVLKSYSFNDAAIIRAMQARFATHGVEPGRLECQPFSPHKELLAQYNSIDIGLDPHPYAGGLTTCESLWMGVPVLTLPGRTFASRHSATHLSNVGLADWMTDSSDAFVAKAKAWAGDLERLASLRAGLRDAVARSPLVDAPRFARNLDQAMQDAWRRWCAERTMDGTPEAPTWNRQDLLPLSAVLEADAPPAPLAALQAKADGMAAEPAVVAAGARRSRQTTMPLATLAVLKEEIAASRPRTIVEFGSGLSTAVLAAAQAAARPGEDVLYISIEQSVDWAGQTRQLLNAVGVRHADLHVVPLDGVSVHHVTSSSYGLYPALAARILRGRAPDMIIVDGPQTGPDNSESRFATVPLLRGLLQPGTEVFMTEGLEQAGAQAADEWAQLNYLEVAGVLPVDRGLVYARAVQPRPPRRRGKAAGS